MSRLRTLLDIVILVGLSSKTIAYVLFLLGLYKVKKSKARKEAERELKLQGIDEKIREELLEVVVPSLGGIAKWMNLKKLRSCC